MCIISTGANFLMRFFGGKKSDVILINANGKSEQKLLETFVECKGLICRSTMQLGEVKA